MPITEKLSFPSETKLVKNTLLGTISKFCKEYSVSLDVKPTVFGTAWRSILHLTIGGNCRAYGDRSPGIWFYPSNPSAKENLIYICSPISRQRNHCCRTKPFPRNKWINLKINQQKVGSDYIYSVYANRKQVCSIKNTFAQDFYDLKVYAADPWHAAQDGWIRNININGKYIVTSVNVMCACVCACACVRVRACVSTIGLCV